MDSNIQLLVDVVSRNISILSNYFGYKCQDFYYNLFDNNFDYFQFIIITICSFLIFTTLGLSIYGIYIFYIFTSFNINKKDEKINKPNIKTFKKGLYFYSLIELSNKNIMLKNEISKYQILLRIKLVKEHIFPKTKYDLHGNNIIGDPNIDNTFKTKDLFMIINLNINSKYSIQHNIVQIMNYINYKIQGYLKNDDFILIMISKNNIDSKEFSKGLQNNNYGKEYILNTIINDGLLDDIDILFTLPIHNVYDIFADTFNNVIFESKNYVMDNNNYESWKNKSINEITSF